VLAANDLGHQHGDALGRRLQQRFQCLARFTELVRLDRRACDRERALDIAGGLCGQRFDARQTLLGAFPKDGFLGEESGDTPSASGFRWIIDPIDGTRNFVRGIPMWATLVGLEYKDEQFAGVAEVPALRHTYRALRGDGAYRNERRIHVSDVADMAKAMLFYSSLSWFVKAGREKTFLDPVLRPVERLIYKLTGVDETREMRWTEYAAAMLLFSLVSLPCQLPVINARPDGGATLSNPALQRHVVIGPAIRQVQLNVELTAEKTADEISGILAKAQQRFPIEQYLALTITLVSHLPVVEESGTDLMERAVFKNPKALNELGPGRLAAGIRVILGGNGQMFVTLEPLVGDGATLFVQIVQNTNGPLGVRDASERMENLLRYHDHQVRQFVDHIL